MNTSAPPSSLVCVALYARVSSERQAQEQTIESQVAALRERVVGDGHALEDALCFQDDGVSGTTLARPALAARPNSPLKKPNFLSRWCISGSDDP